MAVAWLNLYIRGSLVTQIVTVAALLATIALLIVVLHETERVQSDMLRAHRVDAMITQALHAGAGNRTHTTGGANGPQTRASDPACARVPALYTDLARARTWALLGDAFVTSRGASDADAAWPTLLQALARVRVGTQVRLVSVADAHTDDLARQIRALRETNEWRTVLRTRQPAVVFASFGAEWLYGVADRHGGDASVRDLASMWSLLYDAGPANDTRAEALIPAYAAPYVRVVLLVHPDPAAGGVGVPETSMRCAPPFAALNAPTLRSMQMHRAVFDAQRTLLREIAARQQYALIDVDAALAPYAWPGGGGAFADCYAYNNVGHSMLANLIWRCMQGAEARARD